MMEYTVYLAAGTLAWFFVFRVGQVERRFIKLLDRLAEQHNLMVHTGRLSEEIRFLAAKEDVELSYRRPISLKRGPHIQESQMNTMSERRSHVVVLAFLFEDKNEIPSFTSFVSDACSQFSWNWLEKKLEGRLEVRSSGQEVQILLSPPYYSPGLERRTKALFDDAISLKAETSGAGARNSF
ncbi:MAG TPA: hypothetical protein RMG48_02760 [Myxococcales bacterium LLY-WYZ-16_1]|nr:hypothetical protein [Myxococcales bacterium LLY-WYZ-16_1]